jgi:hypothetical protein
MGQVFSYEKERSNINMKFWFPINFELVRGIPINSHPGAFGCARKHNFHEGIDLYGKSGDIVTAIRPGKVISNSTFTGPSEGHPWWLETHALLIQDEDGYYVYGELNSDLKAGDIVSTGQNIGQLTPVLPDYKFRPDIPGHSVTMLHLERWSNQYDPATGWIAWKTRESRPKYLEDPTVTLINILTERRREVKLLTL